MIADDVCTSLKNYISANAGTALAAASITTRGNEGDLSYPAVIVAENGAPEQDELLRCEWTVPVRVVLRTIPEDSTDAAHQVIATDLAGLLGNVDALIGHMGGTIFVHDAYEGQGMTEEESGYRQSEFALVLRVQASLP